MFNRYFLFLFLFVMLTAAGCAKPYTMKELHELNNIPVSFSNSEKIKSISNPNDVIANNDNLINFLYMFDDPELKKIIDIAIEKNTDFLTLASKIKQAKWQARSSLSDMFPGADIGLNYNYSDGNYKKYQTNVTQNTLNASISFSWEIDLFGKLNSLRQSSEELIKYAEESLAGGRVSLISDAATYYFTIRNSISSIDVSKKTLENLEKILKTYEEKLKYGLVDDTEVTSARMDVLTEQNNLASLQNTLEENKNALQVLLDEKKLDMDFMAKYSMPAPKIPKITDIPGNAIFNRPDVMASIYSLNSEIYKRNNAKASLFPSLNINGSIGQIIASSNGMGDLIWQIAGSLVTPLLNRTNLYASLQVQEEARKQAEYSLRKTVGTALGEIENTIFQTDTAIYSMKNSQDYLKNVNSSLQIVTSKYSVGRADETELLQAQNQLLSAQKMLETSKFNRISASINLYKAFGGSFAAPKKDDENAADNR